MKARKWFFMVFILIISVTGLYGCMNEQKEETLASMERYASNKYGCEFTVKSFRAARDETYTNILTLTDGEYIFNVYQCGSSEASDDFPKAVVNQKFLQHLNASAETGLEVYGHFMFANGNEMSLEYAKESDISTIMNDYSLLKVVLVVQTASEIDGQAEALYDLYEEVMGYAPKYIDFEVIQVDNASTKLKDMLSNLPASYDDNWDKYSEIEAYLTVTDTNITSASELIERDK